MKINMESEEPEYPKVMEVSDCRDFRDALKRVVFMEKNGRYLAWIRAETLEEADDAVEVNSWLYARDITPETDIAGNEQVFMLFETLGEVLNELLDHYTSKEE